MRILLIDILRTTLEEVWPSAEHSLGLMYLAAVLRQAALLFLMASGLTLVILTAGLDLSIGANVALSGCLAASDFANSFAKPQTRFCSGPRLIGT